MGAPPPWLYQDYYPRSGLFVSKRCVQPFSHSSSLLPSLPSFLQPWNAGTLQCWCPWMLALSDSPNNFLFVIFTVWYSIIVLKSRLTHSVPITQRKLKPLTLFKDIRGYHGHSSRLLIQLFVWQLLRWSGAFALRWSMCLTFTGLGCLDLWKCLSWEE